MQAALLALFAIGFVGLLVGVWFGALKLAHSATFLGNKKLQAIALTVAGATSWSMEKGQGVIMFHDPFWVKAYNIVRAITALIFLAAFFVLIYPGKPTTPANPEAVQKASRLPRTVLVVFLIFLGIIMLVEYLSI